MVCSKRRKWEEEGKLDRSSWVLSRNSGGNELSPAGSAVGCIFSRTLVVNDFPVSCSWKMVRAALTVRVTISRHASTDWRTSLCSTRVFLTLPCRDSPDLGFAGAPASTGFETIVLRVRER